MTIILWKTHYQWSRILTVQIKEHYFKFNNPGQGI